MHNTRQSLYTQPIRSKSTYQTPLPGATGFIGSRLSAKLAAQGNRVRVLTRDVTSAKGKLPFPGPEFYAPSQWAEAVVGADAVVNLAGTPIGTRWGAAAGCCKLQLLA